MMNSLAMMMMTTQEGIRFISISAIMAEHTNSLSASGSMNFPEICDQIVFSGDLTVDRIRQTGDDEDSQRDHIRHEGIIAEPSGLASQQQDNKRHDQGSHGK